MLTVSVTDQGIGISAEDQEHVFERFFRAVPKGGTSPKGVGLGLFICRSLVEAHGGRIWVESRPGAGSTFCFTLPKLEETEPVEEALPDGLAARAIVGSAS
jgi:signal transduction histidine kinase